MQISIITKQNGNLVKQISILENNVSKDSSQCFISSGQVKTVSLESLNELPGLLDNLSKNKAITLGICEYDKCSLVPKKDYHGQPNAITRTKDFFKFPQGESVIYFDYDPISKDEYLPSNEFIQILSEIFPDISNMGYVINYSSSSHIYFKGDKIGLDGYHIYFAIKDSDDIQRFTDVLFQRLWVNGYGNIFITKSGTQLVRTIFDKAVFSPERLIFEADADCSDEIKQVRPAPHLVEGHILDTHNLPNLSAEEEATYKSIVEQKKNASAAEANQKISLYKNQAIKKLLSNGNYTIDQATKVVTNRLDRILLCDDVLFFDKYGAIPINKVLENLDLYHQETLADPIEPEYGGGYGKAIFYFNRKDMNTVVSSMAHGGRTFRIKIEYKGINNLLAHYNSENEDDLLILMEKSPSLIGRASLNAIQLGKIIKDLSSIIGVTCSDIKKEVEIHISNTGHYQLKTVPAKSTHHTLAEFVTRKYTNKYVGNFISTEGSFFGYDDGLWEEIKTNKFEVYVGGLFLNHTNAKKKADYRAITQHAYNISEDQTFFQGAHHGFATKSVFYGITDQGCVKNGPLKPSHRQRYRLTVDPDHSNNEMPIFDKFLMSIFPGDEGQEQIHLLQEVVGAILTGLFHKFQKVLFLHGAGANGKGVLINILAALLPKEATCAVSPFHWGDDYKRAHLSGKRLNLVGELPGDKLIPSADFKTITGGDTISCRQPYGIPFEIICEAAHVFSGKQVIKTNDHSFGFYRRWLILDFKNKVSEQDMIINLDQKIISGELPQIIAWGLKGVERLVKNNCFSISSAHNEMMTTWRNSVDSIAAFLADTESIKKSKNDRVKRNDLFNSYKSWCLSANYKSIGRNAFYQRVISHGFKIKKYNGSDCFIGLSINSGIINILTFNKNHEQYADVL